MIALAGDRFLEGITVRDRPSGHLEALSAQRVFVCIGGLPNTEWARDTAIVRDAAGYLVTGPDLLLTPDHSTGASIARPFT